MSSLFTRHQLTATRHSRAAAPSSRLPHSRFLLQPFTRFRGLAAIVLAFLAFASQGWGQTTIAGWDFGNSTTYPGGVNNYGPSPAAPNTTAANTTVVGLTRAGHGATGSASANAWGGTGNGTATFTVKANTGYTLSLTQFSAYNVRRSGTGATTGQWAYSLDGTNFTNIGTAITWGSTTTATGNAQTAITLSSISALQNVASSSTITFRLTNSGSTNQSGGNWYLNNSTVGDDFIVTGTVTATSPTISSTGTPSLINTTYGSNSSVTSFSVNGTNMSAGILVTPPAGFQVSTDNSTFSSSNVTVGSSGTISSTTVYLRIPNTTAAGTYSGNITLTSANATQVNVATTSSTVSTRSLTITANAESKTYGNAVSSGSGKTAFTSSGLQNGETIGSVTLTYAGGYNATDTAGTYTITPSAATAGTFTASNYALTYANGTLTVTAIMPSAPTITGITPGDQSLSVAFTAPTSNGGSAITNYEYSTNGGTNWTTPSPAVTTSPLVITGLTNDTPYNVQIRAVNTAGSGTATGSTSGTPAAPSGTITTSGTISAFTATYPAASTEQSFSVSGTGLTGSLTVTAPSGFEVSLTSVSGFGSTATISASGTLASTPVYVRLAASSNAASYSGNVTISGGSATTQNVAATGTVSKATPTVSVAPTASDITYSQTLANSTLSSGTASVNGTFAFTTPATAPSVGTASQPVTFTPTDSTNYNTASTSASVTVNKVTPTVSLAPTASGITYGQTLANSTLSGGTASVAGTYAFTTPATAPSVGTASQGVTFTPTDTTNYNTASTTASVTVSKATPTISDAPTASAITYGQTLASSTLSGGTASVAGTFAFTTSATAPAVGTASQSVTFTPTDGSNYNTASTTASVTVDKATPTLTFNSSSSTTINGTVTLNATSASTGAVTYTSSNNAVVSITSGVATGVAAGTATITASQAADSNYNAVTANQTMTVTAAPVSLAVWNQTWSGTAASPLSANTTATGLTASVTRVSLTGGSSSSRYSASTWNGSSTGANYLSVTINATSSYSLNLNSSTINATWGSSGTGPASYAIYSSVNSFSAPVGTFASSSSGTVNGTITLPSSGYSNLSSIEFRVVGNATSANGGSTVSGGTGGFSYLQFAGIIAQNPPAATAATLNGTVGTALSANITATNSPTGYAISSGTLPAGLSLNATSGQISGTPTVAGNGTIVAVTAANGGGTSASANLTFNIAAIAPTIGSPTVSSINTTSATLGANVTANGGETLSARGTTWGTSASPTVNALAEGNTTVSAFTHSRTGLTANTLYYYRGYATNSVGTAYTADGNFTTLPLAPTVGTGSAVSASGFTANWSHPTMGAASYTYTLDFSTDNTFASGVTTVTGISSASTSQVLTALNASTTYYYRVKAVNAQGSSDWSATSAGVSTPAALGAITTSGTLSAFTATYPAASAEQSFSVSGADLTGSLLVTAPAGFEVSLTSGSGFGATATISASGTLANTTVYVRLPASATVGSYSGNVAVSGGDAATQNIAASGTVSQASQTITFDALATKNATDAAFALTGTVDSGLSITYTSSNTSVATISGNLVTLVGAGSTTITASQAGNTNYAAATSVPQTLTVNKVAQSISGVTSTATKTYGDAAYSLGATVGSGLTITYTSSNTSVATIAANGIVTIVAPGTTTLTASQAGDARYSTAADATQALTVSKANPTLSFSSSNSTTVNGTVTLNATSAAIGAVASTGAVTYTSSNNAVVSIASGVATGAAIGTVTITASQAADSNYNAATANQTMTVAATPSLIFSENMGAPSGTTAISANTFQNNGTLTFGNGSQTNPADVRTSSASSGYTGSSGNGNVFFTSTSGNYGFSIENINVSNYSNLTLSFGYRKESATAHATFSVDYWDGSAWQTIANSSSNLFNETTTAAIGWYLSKSLSLPPSANINGLKIRFVKSGTAFIRIDDVQLLGSIALCEAPVLSRATLPVAGGFTVNWSAVTGAGNYTVLHSASKNMTGATSVKTASTSLAITGLTNGLRYVQVRANNAAGASANSTQQVNQLQSIAAGATSYLSAPGEVGTNTVAGIFGSANEAGLASGATDSASTTILLLNSNGATANTIFYNSSVNQWREGATAMDTTAIAQGKAFMLKNNTGSTDYFLLVGSPRTTQPVVSLNPAGNYTLCTTGRTTPTTLADMNLNPGSGAGAFKTASKAKDADKVIVVDQATGAATNYYHNGTNWMDGLRAVPAAEIPAGQGFFIKKASDSTFSSWTLPAE